MKQKGALLAKGRLLGIQFLELFKDDLYFDLAKHANEMADLLRTGIEEAGYKFLTESPSNQIFPILPNQMVEMLQNNFSFYEWAKIDADYTAVRLVTSWATQKEVVSAFVRDVKNYSA
jgi:threonine aldolase